MDGDDLVLGVSSAPIYGETMWASTGNGAWRDGERVHVAARNSLEPGAITLGMAALDLVIESDVNILDIAALTVIAREAGAVFTDLEGGAINLETRGVLSPDHPSPPQGTADVLLDARLAPRYRGDIEPMDRVAGHLDLEFSNGEHRTYERLKSSGIGAVIIVPMLAMDVAGLTGSRLCAPSWSGWISDPARPVALG
ncbi:MAG: hypothetical protein WDW38_008099 [Sanguina aurantia]